MRREPKRSTGSWGRRSRPLAGRRATRLRAWPRSVAAAPISAKCATTFWDRSTGTARCLILVTPDGQRTMNTYLGACVALGPADIDRDIVAAAQITYLEGYLFDPPQAQEAFRKSSAIAHAAGRKVALSLSDPFCVGRHRAAFRELVHGHVDILFANEAEICSLYETADFAAAAAAVRGRVEIGALTRSAAGSLILAEGAEHLIAAASVARVVDTTGAGDLYASGFLYGLTRNLPLPI